MAATRSGLPKLGEWLLDRILVRYLSLILEACAPLADVGPRRGICFLSQAEASSGFLCFARPVVLVPSLSEVQARPGPGEAAPKNELPQLSPRQVPAADAEIPERNEGLLGCCGFL